MNIDESWPVVGTKLQDGKICVGGKYFNIFSRIGYNNTNRIVFEDKLFKILKAEFNVHLIPDDGTLHPKALVAMRRDDILKIYVNQYMVHHCLGFIWLLNKLQYENKLIDFEPIVYHSKFRPIYKINTLKIAKMFKAREKVRVLGAVTATKKGVGTEEAFLSYYLMVSSFTDINTFKWSTMKSIEYLSTETKNMPILYNKIIFKGHRLITKKGQNIRQCLYELANNPKSFIEFNDKRIPFIDMAQYKYILAMHGLNRGCHDGRRFWLFHMNRVLFLPIDDARQWFNELDNPPEPWIHYIPYSEQRIVKTKSLSEIEEAYNKLESNSELYNTIKNNCSDYAKKYLSYEAVEDFVIKKLS